MGPAHYYGHYQQVPLMVLLAGVHCTLQSITINNKLMKQIMFLFTDGMIAGAVVGSIVGLILLVIGAFIAFKILKK